MCSGGDYYIAIGMKKVFISVGCSDLENLVSDNSSLLLTRLRFACASQNDSFIRISADVSTNSSHLSDKKLTDDNSGAVLYIVAVLVFYSMCIAIMIMNYLARAKSELEEERILEDFFRSMPEREQDKVNHFAIHAFHTLTTYNDDDRENSSVNSAEYDDVFIETEVERDELAGNSNSEKLTGSLIPKICTETDEDVFVESEEFESSTGFNVKDIFNIQNGVEEESEKEVVYATRGNGTENNNSLGSICYLSDNYIETDI